MESFTTVIREISGNVSQFSFSIATKRLVAKWLPFSRALNDPAKKKIMFFVARDSCPEPDNVSHVVS